ncbi:MAG: hypothetical protein HY736_10255 [Verrucomicrobia bacterium]|nr:hypothetical protein [Verrucomicrobiota bacterium]
MSKISEIMDQKRPLCLTMIRVLHGRLKIPAKSSCRSQPRQPPEPAPRIFGANPTVEINP